MKNWVHIRLETVEGRIGILTMDHAEKDVNVLDMEMVGELSEAIATVRGEPELIGLIVRSGKKNQFIAGASIDEIASLSDVHEASEKARLGQRLMNDIASLSIPTVAAINGPCLGGGYELALACTFRVADDGSHVKIGLPETQLGIIPGFGGTQRLPKLIGFEPALSFILKGSALPSKVARRKGLVDEIVPGEILDQVAVRFLLAKKKLPSYRSLLTKTLEAITPYRKLICRLARKSVLKKTSGFYPAPLAAIDVLETTFLLHGQEGYEIEANKVGELICSPVCKALIQIFQFSESIRKKQLPGEALIVDKVGVLGAGVMGGGIAQLLSSKNYWVRMRDISKEALAKSLDILRSLNLKEVSRKRITEKQSLEREMRVSATTDWSGFSKCQFAIEAVIENLDIKKEVLRELESRVAQDTILASNTSALSISEMAKSLAHPQRMIGLHFFNPVGKMPLVEIIRGEQTSDTSVATTFALAKSLGKTPLIVEDRPGFLVNRILGIYLNEASRAAQDGMPVEDIEKTMKSFGMPMGPFELIDEIGLDVAEKVGLYLTNAYSHFGEPGVLLSSVHSDGRLGKKNGKGFYLHRGSQKKLDQTYLRKKIATLTQSRDWSMETSQYEDLVDRLVLLMVNEACRCLEEKVVAHPSDIEIGMVFGTQFPPFRGGLLSYANQVGIPIVIKKLEKLSEKFGARFEPANLLREIKSDPRGFRFDQSF